MTIAELAKGELQDRAAESHKSSEWWRIVVAAVLAAVLSVIGTLIIVSISK